MSDRILNWGLLSTARINEALIHPLQASSHNHLLAVGSRSGSKAKKYAEEWQIPKSYGNYEDLLADPEIDVIYNSLPNSLHMPWTVEAAKAGKHVLCEKPLALTTQEVDQMESAASKYGVFISEAFMYRHHPQTLRIKELVQEGNIGELRLVRGAFSYHLDDLSDVRLNPELGGGSIWDIGCYPISFIRMIFGEEPLEVFGQMDTTNSGVDLSFVGQMRFSGNRFGQFDCSFAGPFRWEIEIVGTEGSIFVPNPYKPAFNDYIELHQRDQAEKLSMPGKELYIGEVEDLADSILNEKPPRISLQDSHDNVKAITSLLQSAHANKPLSLV